MEGDVLTELSLALITDTPFLGSLGPSRIQLACEPRLICGGDGETLRSLHLCEGILRSVK